MYRDAKSAKDSPNHLYMCCCPPWKGYFSHTTGVFGFFAFLQKPCNIAKSALYQSIADNEGYHLVTLLSGLGQYIGRYVIFWLIIRPEK